MTRGRINRGESICRERLEDYFHLKLVKINVYIYILCVETVSIIQDSMLLLGRAGRGRVEPYVNICLVPDRDMFFRGVFQRLCFLQRSHMG